MISHATITVSPTGYPVSVTEITTHAIIEHALDDTLIETYLKAAIAELDPPNGYLGRAMMEQTVVAYLERFPGIVIQLPFPPLISVTSLKYQDDDGNEQTFSSSKYEVITGVEPGQIALLDDYDWPDDLDDIQYPIWIEYQAGYALSGGEITVPEGIRLYLKMLVAEMYAHRQLTGMEKLKPVWKNMIEKYRHRFPGWS